MRKSLIERLWNSPTFTTWASFGARTLNLVLVLPLVLSRFTAEEVALWQVMSTLISLQLLADAALGPTFSRFIAYAMGGAQDLSTAHERKEQRDVSVPNWELLSRIFATMRALYRRWSWILGVVTIIGGTWALQKRIAILDTLPGSETSGGRHVTTSLEAWIGWGIIFGTTMLNFRANGYAALLQGTNHVALLRRWEALFGIGSIGTSALALAANRGVLALVVANQVWFVLGGWRNLQLCKRVLGGRFNTFPRPSAHSDIVNVVWPAGWRAGVGAFMAYGVVHISGLLFAQNQDSVSVASYLIGVRLLYAFTAISQAPFYTKVPILARLWAEGRVKEQLEIAALGMRMAHWAFVVPFILAGSLGPWAMNLIGSKTPFPNPWIWCLLGSAMLVERYGAMHIQLCSATNRIIWHIANGVTGVIFCVVSLALYPKIGVVALPLGMLCGNLGFYAWYCSRLSHITFSLPWPQFDLKTVGMPALALVGYVLWQYIRWNS